MAQPKNTLLRVMIPLAGVMLGLAVVAAVFVNSGKRGPAARVS